MFSMQEGNGGAARQPGGALYVAGASSSGSQAGPSRQELEEASVSATGLNGAAYDRVIHLPEGRLTDSIPTTISYREAGFPALVHQSLDAYMPGIINKMSLEQSLDVVGSFSVSARNSFQDVTSGRRKLEVAAWNKAISVINANPSVLQQRGLDGNNARRAVRIGQMSRAA